MNVFGNPALSTSKVHTHIRKIGGRGSGGQWLNAKAAASKESIGSIGISFGSRLRGGSLQVVSVVRLAIGTSSIKKTSISKFVGEINERNQ